VGFEAIALVRVRPIAVAKLVAATSRPGIILPHPGLTSKPHKGRPHADKPVLTTNYLGDLGATRQPLIGFADSKTKRAERVKPSSRNVTRWRCDGSLAQDSVQSPSRQALIEVSR
jgi:hypothetical protein